jgi:nucleotide-binding universal stress UspA family protein
VKAIIATDGSAQAVDAALVAERLLHPDVEFLIVAVVPEPEDPLQSAGGIEGPLVTEEEAEKMTSEAAASGQEAILRTARTVHEPMTAQLLRDDDPATALCRLAEDQQADVLVIGASEKGLLERIFQGSVMRSLVKHAPCPVLVVRHDD